MRLTDLDAAAPFVTADGSTIRAGAATGKLDFITAGRGRMRLDGEERDVRPGDCSVIPPGARHTLFTSGPEPLRLPCRCAAASRHDDTVLTDG
jgi:mannose-6-phosphate isomerase-like protein (cupin superfamily)